jgi:hypothetical protein
MTISSCRIYQQQLREEPMPGLLMPWVARFDTMAISSGLHSLEPLIAMNPYVLPADNAGNLYVVGLLKALLELLMLGLLMVGQPSSTQHREACKTLAVLQKIPCHKKLKPFLAMLVMIIHYRWW